MTTRTLLRPVLTTVLVGALVLVGADLIGRPLHPVLAPVAIALVAVTTWLARHRVVVSPTPWARTTGTSGPLTHDRRLSSLSWAVHGLADGRTWERTLAPLLLDQVRHRLRTRHDVDLDTEPELATARLPAELRAFVDDPTTAPRSLSALRTIVSRIEEI
ncbi:hypothetical protein [Arsenicicoccus sp. oral taxon 190]|uniref:hypothetical protein n=1 Tax=Arsenicicoccus sp. oral taxon 190 TaxID=1658671 RepID=UPI00067A4329|nr:hypothetical protein [Arsenicicoccus sp. oral taxon 190]AKT51527.1 hypothetical protein ADJ73_09785 [Arsenicicoccus sp. oral taxon 190]